MKNTKIIKAILNKKMSDEDSIFYIQSYLLNWKTIEDIKKECPVTVLKYIENKSDKTRVRIYDVDSIQIIYHGTINEMPNSYKDYIVINAGYFDELTDDFILNVITKEE